MLTLEQEAKILKIIALYEKSMALETYAKETDAQLQAIYVDYDKTSLDAAIQAKITERSEGQKIIESEIESIKTSLIVK